MPRLNMSIVIRPETIVANGMLPPIGMMPFPPVETFHSERFTDQPDIARSQIKRLVADETDIFDAIPGVIVRNHDWLCRHHDHRWRRSHNHHWHESHLAIWLKDAA